MNITIIGASAGIGLETVKRALLRKHKVTTLSRSQPPIDKNENINFILGSALNKSDLKESIKDSDAVVVALGKGKDFKATTLFSDFAENLLEVQREIKIEVPIIVVTGFGSGESRNYSSWLAKLFFKFFLEENYKDKAKMEKLITSSNINWIVVRPGKLTDTPLTEKYRIETKLIKGMNINSISRKDVADYVIKQAENPTEFKKYVAITSK